MRVTIHLPDILETEIKQFAEHEHKSVSALLTEAAQFYLREQRKRRAHIPVGGVRFFLLQRSC